MDFKNERIKQIISIIVYLIFIAYAVLTMYSDLPGDCANVMNQSSPDYGSWKSYAILFATIFICVPFVYQLLHLRTVDLVEVIHEFLPLLMVVVLIIGLGLYKSYGEAGFKVVCSAF